MTLILPVLRGSHRAALRAADAGLLRQGSNGRPYVENDRARLALNVIRELHAAGLVESHPGDSGRLVLTVAGRARRAEFDLTITRAARTAPAAAGR